ncbi:MAG TPA: hypothetical protein VMW52_01690 [Phycisphaerae bacterium]|nr:hypothetical protein [Phycisphaerae bacterium]
MRYFPGGYFPVGHWPQGYWPGGLDAGGYVAYIGPVAADMSYQIDYETPVAYAPPGSTQIEIAGQSLADGVWAIGLRCTSSAGVEETNTDRVVIVEIAGGVLLYPQPNGIVAASARAVAGAKMELSFTYSARREAGTAAGIQVAELVGGSPDWDNLLQTIAMRGTCRMTRVLDEVFDHGEVVRLAVRAVSDQGTAGPALLLDPVTADSVGPDPVDYLTVSQVSA